MQFVTKEFLAGLRTALPEPVAAGTVNSGITDVFTDRKQPRFDIEVISGVRIGDRWLPSDGSYSPEMAAGLAESFRVRLGRLRTAFPNHPPANLLVNCGDLVADPADGSAPERRHLQSSYAEVCLPAFRRLGEARADSGSSDDTVRAGTTVLSIPGNEDARPVNGARQGAADPGP